MATQRTLSEKTEDIKRTFEQFAETLTDPKMREQAVQWQAASESAALAGDAGTYSALASAQVVLTKTIAANDRAALIAAVMANSGAPARVLPGDLIDGSGGE